MNIDQLPYLLAIVSEGNPSAAARHLDVSQQALSKYLNELERELGLELFFRSKRQYLPTPAGQIYLQTAREILELKRHTFETLERMEKGEPVRLRLGVSPNRGIEAMAKLYPHFERRYPHVTLDISEGYANQLREMLINGQLDAVLSTYVGEKPTDCLALPIHSEELVLAVPSFHPLVHHESAPFEELPFAELKDFRDAVFIMPRSASTLHDLVRGLFEREQFQPQVALSVPNIQMQLAMIRSGTRVGILPAYYVRPHQEVSFFRLYNSPHLTMVYLAPKEHVYSEAERYLIWLLLRMKYQESAIGIEWSEPLQDTIREFGPLEGGTSV